MPDSNMARPSFHSAPPAALCDSWRALLRYKGRAAAFFAVTMTLVIVGLILAPRKYESEARLFVRVGRENVALDPTATTGQIVSLDTPREAEINSIVEMLRSRSVVEKVFDRVGAEKPVATPREREKAIQSLAKDITVRSPRQSTVLVVSCTARTPRRAQKVVATLLDVYLAEHIRVNRTPGSYEFFEEQAALLKTQLEATSAALRDAKNEDGLLTLEGRRTGLQEQINYLEQEILKTESALSASEAKIETLRVGLEELPEALVSQLVGGSPTQQQANLRQKLYELQTREQELLSKCTEEHPAVIAIRQQVREAQRIYRQETPEAEQGRCAAVLTEQSKAASLRAQAEALNQQRARLREQLEALNQQELRISQLQREEKLLETNYLAYSEKLEHARIDQALKAERISNVSVIQPASFAPEPVSPKTQLALLFGFAVALAGGVGLCWLSDRLQQPPGSSEEGEHSLGPPVTVSIPHTDGHPLNLSGIQIGKR